MGRASRSKLKKVRRKNAKLYPFYKMFSWDFLCFYSIEFLFLTITKGVRVSDVLFLDAFYLICKMLAQLPSVMITDFLGRKKSIILGNVLVTLYLLILILAPNIAVILIGKVFCAFGFVIKALTEGNLLYDSVATKGGDGLFAKIDTRGGSLYYICDGTAALIAGYLFVINNYLPVTIALICFIIATIISCGFSDVYNIRRDKENKPLDTIKEYSKDLKDTCKFIFRSNRMKAYILFKMVFSSLIRIIDIYKSDLLLNLEIAEEQFSMIFAMFTFVAALAVSSREVIEKKFKNRTLSFISLLYIASIIGIGIVSLRMSNIQAIPIVLIMLVIVKVTDSVWKILEGKYMRNFTSETVRSKITFTCEFFGCLACAISTILAGKLIQFVNIRQAFLLVGLIGLVALILTLDYMRTRFGLKSNEYDKKDIEFP